uniref:Histamine N-methyltransferase n=2 Tax=Micrurus TaxID=8634 RepID=A0A2D4KJT5_9SAUR
MTMRSLFSNHSHYVETFQVFLKKSTEHQCMLDFIHKKLPQLISSISNGKTDINVLSIGGGSGEIDLEILARLQSEYPGVIIHTDVIEPNAEQINSYKGMFNTAASAELHDTDPFAPQCSRVRYGNMCY